jgi:hypothetical protein
MMTPRAGWGVAIRRADGSEFLALSGVGILSAVWPLAQRKYAVEHKRELVCTGFVARVVRVAFTVPMIQEDRRA